MLKKNSELWKLAKKYARRKYVNSKPVNLSQCGNYVTMQSLIRGNTWQYSINDFNQLLGE